MDEVQNQPPQFEITGDAQAQIEFLLQDEQAQIQRIMAQTRMRIAALLAGNQNTGPAMRSNAQYIAPPVMENAPPDDEFPMQQDELILNYALPNDEIPIAHAIAD